MYQVTFSKLKFPRLKFIIKRFVLVNQIVNYVFSSLPSLGAAGRELNNPDVEDQFVRSCEKLKSSTYSQGRNGRHTYIKKGKVNGFGRILHRDCRLKKFLKES
jgi:hypothetical protein